MPTTIARCYSSLQVSSSIAMIQEINKLQVNGTSYLQARVTSSYSSRHIISVQQDKDHEHNYAVYGCIHGYVGDMCTCGSCFDMPVSDAILTSVTTH